MNQAGSEDVGARSALDALRRATEAWRSATADCSTIDWQLLAPTDDALPGYIIYGRNENVVYWYEANWPHDADVVALTIVTKKRSGTILDADIIFNGQQHTFSTDAADKTRDIQSTLTHELGHVLGLDHTCDAVDDDAVDHRGQPVPACETASASVRGALMYPRSAAGQTRRVPQADDALGICEIYPLADEPHGGCACRAAAPRGHPPLLPVFVALWWLLRALRRKLAAGGRE